MLEKGEKCYQYLHKIWFVYVENPRESTDKLLELLSDIKNTLLESRV